MSVRGTTWDAFVTKIIDDGIAAARADYAHDAAKMKGAVAGFEACRNKDPLQLRNLLSDARRKAGALYFVEEEKLDAYWEARCFELEVEWVCNVVSAALVNRGDPPILQPTARGVMKAAEILGVGPQT